MSEIIIITPVGTSLMSNTHDLDGKTIDILKKYPERFRDCYNENDLNIAEYFNYRQKSKHRQDKNPAEISSLYAFKTDPNYKDRINGHTIRVILVHSPGIGEVCAEKIKYLIEGKRSPFNGWKCELKKLKHLNVNNKDEFQKSIEELTNIIRKQYENNPHRLYLNITGGYKALVPYLTMISMAVGRKVAAFYLFEDSPNILMLPVYPFSFDLRLWRDWRGILGPFDPKLKLEKEQKEPLYKTFKNTRLKDLINIDEDKYELNTLGQWMNELYDTARDRSMTEFGEGENLLNMLDGKKADYLRKRIPYWRHFATSDHIPETVEHGRGHVQRLLELAQQLIIAAEIELNDEKLFVLICSIWLHDLGHSGDGFHFEGENGIILDCSNHKSTEFVPVYKDPDSVRKYHNFLSYELLKNEEKFIFDDKIQDIDNKGLLRRSIRLACLYHRQVMPVKGAKDEEDDVFRISKGIENFITGSEVIEGFPIVAAILRFIDGADNQIERAYSEEHFKVTEWVLKRQSDVLENEWKKDGNPVIKMQLDFKRIQAKHFEKHRLVKHVYIVKSNTRGNGNKSVSIINIANKGSAYNRKQLLDEIITGFYKEYILVENLLLFNIQVFIYEKNADKYDIIRVKWDAIAQKAMECTDES
ncbi:MAG: hypothetical protein KAW56_09605 [Candidatus Marinimicrobia bacterium]|nr:hypothetical protein [Candidatus Neomarinimicrobiota bacterium]